MFFVSLVLRFIQIWFAVTTYYLAIFFDTLLEAVSEKSVYTSGSRSVQRRTVSINSNLVLIATRLKKIAFQLAQLVGLVEWFEGFKEHVIKQKEEFIHGVVDTFVLPIKEVVVEQSQQQTSKIDTIVSELQLIRQRLQNLESKIGSSE
jgi:hypothetical protein